MMSYEVGCFQSVPFIFEYCNLFYQYTSSKTCNVPVVAFLGLLFSGLVKFRDVIENLVIIQRYNIIEKPLFPLWLDCYYNQTEVFASFHSCVYQIYGSRLEASATRLKLIFGVVVEG